MLELTGARLVDGTVDVGGPGPAPKTLRLRDEKVTRLLGTQVPLGEQAELLERLEFGVVDARRRARRHRPGLPPQRRHARGRPDRGGRAAVGAREAPGHDPRPRHAAARLTVEQKLRRRAGDALVGAGFSEAIGWSFQSPETERRLRLDVPAVRLRNPLSEDLSEMRTTLLGSLLTLRAATTPRAGPRTCGCSRRARSTSTARTGASRPRPRRARRRCPTSGCTSRR